MSEFEQKPVNKYLETFKWYGAGCLITTLVFFSMLYFKMEMRNIAGVFQVSSGILLGGLLRMRSGAPCNK